MSSEADVWQQFLSQQQQRDPVLKADLKGKVVVITGANTGIGFEAAKHFATMGPKKLILACRSKARGDTALERLKKDTGFEAAEVWTLDQGSFESVKAFATKVDEELDRLDILVENAGVGFNENAYTIGQDGWEETFQVNNLSPELLTLLALPKIIKTKEDHGVTPRIVLLTSIVSEWAVISEEFLNSADLHKELSSEAYSKSRPENEVGYNLQKLLSVFFARGLQKRLSPSTVIINAANPGYCESELFRDMAPEKRAALAPFDAHAYSSEEGGRHIVWPALAHQGEDTLAGAYVSTSLVKPVSQFLSSDLGTKFENKLWDDGIQIFSKLDARVPGIVSKYLA